MKSCKGGLHRLKDIGVDRDGQAGLGSHTDTTNRDGKALRLSGNWNGLGWYGAATRSGGSGRRRALGLSWIRGVDRAAFIFLSILTTSSASYRF